MPAINANIVVEPIDLNITQTSISQVVTVEPIDLTVSTSAPMATLPGGTPGELQYNNSGSFGGVANTSVASGTLTFTNLANLSIDGGTNGYVLQTDGLGSLSWVAQGGAGTGNPGGSNTQIQFNDAGVFGGNVGFTFNKGTGNVDIPGVYNGDGGGLSNIAIDTIANGTSNVEIATVDGNIDFAVNGVAIATMGSTGLETNYDITINGSNFVGSGNFTSVEVSDTTSIHEAIEDVQLISVPTGTYVYDVLNGSIQYATANATANLVLNFDAGGGTFNGFLDTGKSFTGTYLMTNGATPYAVTGVEIDAVSQTIDWAGGFVPLETADSIQSYTFTIIKTSATPTYTVLGSLTRYG